MSMTGRDRGILLVLLVLAAMAGYWFLALGPKREEASKAADELAEAEERRDGAVSRLADLEAARTDYATDYATVVRLGKAIPASLDTASLMVQLQRAAHGTDIEFDRIAAGQRSETGSEPASGAPPAAAPNGAAAPGGAPAQTGAESATENAGGAVNQTNAQNEAAAGQSGVAPGDAQTSKSTREGGLPVGGGTAPDPADAGARQPETAPGLESVPLEFTFTGNFFHLADFFHDVKRYVHVANEELKVQGRLMTIDGFRLYGESEIYPQLKAELLATAFLTPKAEGPTAGATPNGPAAVTPAQSSTAQSEPGGPPAAAATP